MGVNMRKIIQITDKHLGHFVAEYGIKSGETNVWERKQIIHPYKQIIIVPIIIYAC